MANADALERIKASIEEQARFWAADFISDRKDFLARRKIEATGRLKESLQSQIINQASSNIVDLLIEFEEYGRFLDMKRLQPSKGGDNYITALEDWLKTKGFFEKFKKKYEAKYGRIKSETRALNRMAWGVAIVRGKGKYRRRRWYNKPKTAAISELYNQIIANLPSIASEEVAKNFQ